jgi:hypothetical protein
MLSQDTTFRPLHDIPMLNPERMPVLGYLPSTGNGKAGSGVATTWCIAGNPATNAVEAIPSGLPSAGRDFPERAC